MLMLPAAGESGGVATLGYGFLAYLFPYACAGGVSSWRGMLFGRAIREAQGRALFLA
jgi:hypothetical protein